MAGLFASMSSATLIEKCCLISNPVAGNPTHYLVEQAFAQKGLDWRFMTFEMNVPIPIRDVAPAAAERIVHCSTTGTVLSPCPTKWSHAQTAR